MLREIIELGTLLLDYLNQLFKVFHQQDMDRVSDPLQILLMQGGPKISKTCWCHNWTLPTYRTLWGRIELLRNLILVYKLSSAILGFQLL